MRGLPSGSAATQTSRAACPCCLARVQHRMGIYLHKGAKAGCSSRNRGPPDQPAGAWAISLGLTRNPAAGNAVA